jgi:hypothetical protein
MSPDEFGVKNLKVQAGLDDSNHVKPFFANEHLGAAGDASKV